VGAQSLFALRLRITRQFRARQATNIRGNWQALTRARIGRSAASLSVAITIVSCDMSKPPRVETYYTPIIGGQALPLPQCTHGQAISFRPDLTGPEFGISPQSSNLYRKQLTLIVSAGGPEQPNAGDFTVVCRSALLTTSGSAHPPISSDGAHLTSPCGDVFFLKTNDIQPHSVMVEFASSTELADVVTLKLPEVLSTKTGTVYPSITVDLHKVVVAECPEIRGFR